MAWGTLAECWLRLYTPSTNDMMGVHGDREYPVSAGLAVTTVMLRSGNNQGYGRNPRNPKAAVNDPTGQILRYVQGAKVGASYVTHSMRSGIYTPERLALRIQEQDFIFRDYAREQQSGLRFRVPKLHPEEVDPCGGTT